MCFLILLLSYSVSTSKSLHLLCFFYRQVAAFCFVSFCFSTLAHLDLQFPAVKISSPMVHVPCRIRTSTQLQIQGINVQLFTEQKQCHYWDSTSSFVTLKHHIITLSPSVVYKLLLCPSSGDSLDQVSSSLVNEWRKALCVALRMLLWLKQPLEISTRRKSTRAFNKALAVELGSVSETLL